MQLIEYLMALAVAAAVAWLLASIGRFRSGPLEWLGSGFAWLVTGWRGDPWPRGVQEEDPERPWGRPPPTRIRCEPIDKPPPPPTLVAVRPHVRHR